MSGVGASITVQDSALRAELARLQAHLTNLTPVMRSIGQTLRTNVDLGFRGEHDPWGVPWRPLSEATLRQRRGTSAQILRDTGRLANSMTYRADRNSVSVGTNVEYASDHQFGMPRGGRGQDRQGAPIPWGDIPARPMLPIRNGRVDLPAEWRADVLATLSGYLTS